MSDPNSREQLRKVPAHLFEMLPTAEAEALKEELKREPNAHLALERVKERLSHWDPHQHPSHEAFAGMAAGDSWDVAEHALTCRECAFELAVLAAEAKGSSSADAFPGSASLWLRAAAALAIGGGAFFLGSQSGESPLPDSVSIPLVLQSSRGAGTSTISLATFQGQNLTLVVQAPIPPGPASWNLIVAGERVAEGELVMGPGPQLRDLAFSVPSEGWKTGSGILTLTGADGSVLRVWDFSINP